MQRKPGLSQDFYDTLRPISDFAGLAGSRHYADVPDDWFVGVADIVDSTGEIAAGRYKTVNMIAASVISAMVNALKPRAFPYVFGGDGAGFALWPEAKDRAARTLATIQSWAAREFDIQLRVALVPVSAIRAAGLRVQVARYQASEGVDYAMFSGGGLTWAEIRMKEGAFGLDPVTPDDLPDLDGLSCRWTNMRARNGCILSVVILPGPQADPSGFAALARDVLKIGEGLDLGGHPVPPQGPDISYPPPGLDLDARVSRRGRPLWWRKAQLLAANLFFGLLFLTRAKLGKFDAQVYRAQVAANADFRKFDDGLKMTLDTDAQTRRRLKAVLREAQAAGIARYGLSEQDEAMMTCFVPSPVENTHVHFVDGAGGGYARAAAALKAAQ